MATSRLHCDEIHHPFFALELEIQTIAKQSIRPGRKPFRGILGNCPHGFYVARSNTTFGNTDISLLMDNSMSFEENSIQERKSMSLMFSAPASLADAPGMFANTALSPSLAEMIYPPSATGRLRVLCGHTRESWQKMTDLIWKRTTLLYLLSTKFSGTSQNFS